ncbi:MAG: PD-(D/E)XK nuclease family protein [Elusimicrobiales bacterium]|nr:PD-(D/E)XK nuclease family protein [Elusimicrobiales bacterium]
MKLFYSPLYTGHVYTGLENAENGILFDTETVSTQGLLDTIKLHAGLRRKIKPQGERFVAYYKAMSAYMKDTRDSVFRESFNTDPLKTAEQCLAWRDALAAAGWNAGTQAQSARLKALQGIEKHFTGKNGEKKENFSLAEDIFAVTEEIKAGCPLPAGLEIQMPFDWNILPPAEKGLIQALQNRNVKIILMPRREDKGTNLDKITALLEGKNEGSNNGRNTEKEIMLAENDDTFKILHFADRTESMKYLSTLPAETFNVWINENNQELDSWLKLAGKPAAGSGYSGVPQAAQMLITGLSIFYRPLNIINLVEWLNMPYFPVDRDFRKELAEAITGTGGYINQQCRDIIAKYSKETDKNIFFIPDIDSPDNIPSLKDIIIFAEKIHSHCRQMSAMLADNPAMQAQFAEAASQCELLALLYEDSNLEKQITEKELDSIISMLYRNKNYAEYSAEAGTMNLVNSPACFAASPENVIWCGYYGFEEPQSAYSFLSIKEKTELTDKGLKIWEEEKERTFRRNCRLLPFKIAKTLTLVTADKQGAAVFIKNADYIRLEKYFTDEETKELKQNFRHHIKEMSENNYREELIVSEPEIIDNRMEKQDNTKEEENDDAPKSYSDCIKFERTDLIKWCGHESYSSLDSLINHPMDYAFERLAGISPSGLAALPDIKKMKGTVAHKTIEILFSPKANIPESGKPSYIKNQLCNMDEIINATAREEGGLLFLKENRIEYQTFAEELKNCINVLLKIMEENSLSVIGMEQMIEDENMGFNPQIQIKGFADMVLQDQNGTIFLFDLKFTSPKKYHKGLLEEDKSIQLALYKKMFEHKHPGKTVKTAYFTMPAAKLFSYDEIQGAEQITSALNGDIIDKIRHSYTYRRNQISSGMIESADGLTADSIQYAADSENKKLLPLDFKNNQKTSNSFSKVQVLKGRK